MMVVSDLASAKSCSVLSARAFSVSASTFTLRRRWHQRLSRPCPPVWHTRRPHGLPRLAAQSAEVKVTHACVEAETCARCCQRRCRRAPMLGRGRRRVSVRSTGASCFPAPALVPLIGGDARFLFFCAARSRPAPPLRRPWPWHASAWRHPQQPQRWVLLPSPNFCQQEQQSSERGLAASEHP